MDNSKCLLVPHLTVCRASPDLRVLNFCGDKETRASKQEELLSRYYKVLK